MGQIQPATHEAKGHLYYHPEPGARYDGLDPYWTLGSFLIDEFDGYAEIETTLDGEHVRIELTYSKSGFAPRAQDDVQERLYEFEVHVDGHHERKCHFNVSPRFENMQHYETAETITTPFDHLDADEGCSVQFQASNYNLDEIPPLLPRAITALADHADTDFNTLYFDSPQGGRIAEIERYVRVNREMNKKLIQDGGLFNRLAILLGGEKGTKGERTWDNTEQLGYHHQVKMCPTSAGKLIPDHTRGRQLKSYLPQNPENFDEDDPLFHPKLGVLFRKSLNKSESVPWSERRRLVDSLDETLINALDWSEIPVDVGDRDDATGSNGVFVADDHFKIESRHESVPIFDDPTPKLEAEQDHLLMTVLRDMTDSDTEIVETVATDGGTDVDELADESGYSLSTIYRALDRLDGVLENRDGHVEFFSKKIAEEVRGIVQSAEYAIESAADRVSHLLDVEVNQADNSAVSRWLNEYGAEFVEVPGDDGRGKIRIDTIMSELKSRPHPNLSEVLDYLVHAWVTDGRRHYNIEEMLVEVDLANGDHLCSTVKSLR